MSRRYGRQQKRAARKCIEMLKELAVKNMREADYYRRLGQINQEAVNVTREVLGKYFIGLPPQETIDVSNQWIDRLRVPKPMRLGIPGEGATIDLIVGVNELNLVSFSAHRDRLQGVIRARVTLKGKDFGFAMSDEALRYLDIDEYLKMVADEWSLHLLRELKVACREGGELYSQMPPIQYSEELS